MTTLDLIKFTAYMAILALGSLMAYAVTDKAVVLSIGDIFFVAGLFTLIGVIREKRT